MGDSITIPSRATGEAAEPEIDILLCTHNRADLLSRCLQNLEQQTLDRRHWGLVLVLNACTDGSDAVAEAARARGALPHFRIVREPTPGLTLARRSGLAETTATWVLMLDDDCLLDDDWLGEAHRFLRAHPRAGALGGRQEVVWLGEPHPVARDRPEAFAAQDHGEVAREVTLDHPRGLVGSALLFRRDALLQSAWARHPLMAGHRGSAVTSGDDTEMFVRVLQAGHQGWYLPTLRLRHLIPAARTDLEHLGRLYRGYAATRVIMTALRQPKRPTWASLAGNAMRHLLRCWRHGLARTMSRIAGRGTTGVHLRACVRRGRVDGALTLLRNRARL